MGTIRGRAIKVGGVAFQNGAAPRTNDAGVVRPAFAINAGIRQPMGGPGAGFSLGHPLLDLGSPSGWRVLYAGLALAYVIGFHVTLGRTRLGLGPAR